MDKRKRMKLSNGAGRGIVISCLLAMVLGLTACGSGTQTKNGKNIETKDITYAYSKVSIPDMKGNPTRVYRLNGKVYVQTEDWLSQTPVFRVYQLDDSYKQADLVYQMEEDEQHGIVGGIIWLTEESITYWRTTESNQKKEIIESDLTGKINNEIDVTDYFVEDATLNSVCKSAKGNYLILSAPQMMLVNEAGKKIAKVDVKGEVCGCTINREGELVVAVNEEQGVVAYILNEKDGALSSDVVMDYMTVGATSENALCNGDENYDYYLRGASRLYGYDSNSKRSIPLLDYTASAMQMTESMYVVPVSAQQALGIYDGTGIATLASYRRLEPSEIKEKQIITVGGLYLDGNSSISDAVAAFNKSNPEYQIEMKNYSMDNCVEQFNLDVAAGKLPDVLVLNDNSPIEEYISMGMLEDLYPYLDKDEDYSREDMIDSVRNAMEVNGGLYYLSGEFWVNSMVVPTEYVGKDKENWTIRDMMSVAEKYPDAALFWYTGKNQILYNLTFCNLADFVDWERKECHFDSEEFVDMLRLANERGSEDENAMAAAEEDQLEAYHNREVLFDNSSYIDIYAIQEAQRIYGTKEVTMIGMPNEEGSGSCFTFQNVYAISSASKVKEGAWQFVRTVLDPDYEAVTSIRKDLFQKQMEAYLDPANEMTGGGSDGYTSWEYERPSEEVISQFEDLVNQTDRVEWRDSSVYDIVEEEAKACFAGQRSEEETAKIIQTRITTYMNEKKK